MSAEYRIISSGSPGVLDLLSKTVQTVLASGAGAHIQLPAVARLQRDRGPVFYIVNVGSNTFAVKNVVGTTLFSLTTGQAAEMVLDVNKDWRWIKRTIATTLTGGNTVAKPERISACSGDTLPGGDTRNVGAICYPNGQCVQGTETLALATDGVYQGDGTNCIGSCLDCEFISTDSFRIDFSLASSIGSPPCGVFVGGVILTSIVVDYDPVTNEYRDNAASPAIRIECGTVADEPVWLMTTSPKCDGAGADTHILVCGRSGPKPLGSYADTMAGLYDLSATVSEL